MPKPTIIAGTCVIESEDLCLKVAEELQEVCDKLKFDYYFKASFEKANRSHKSSYTGLGMEKGLKILSNVKKKLGVKLYTDFHLPDQAMPVAEVVDGIQVPAFLCRQTSMIEAADKACAKYKRLLTVKKGQFLAPQDTQNIKSKITKTSEKNVAIIERGTSFGYGYLVVDFCGFDTMKEYFQNMIFDCTHSVQRPSSGSTTGGAPIHIPTLMKASIMAGATGLFLETHPDPKKALSDGANCLALSKMENLLENARRCFDLSLELKS